MPKKKPGAGYVPEEAFGEKLPEMPEMEAIEDIIRRYPSLQKYLSPETLRKYGAGLGYDKKASSHAKKK